MNPETYVYKVAGDCEIRADAYGTSGGSKRPVLVFIHGGALINGRRTGLRPWQLQRYLEAGYALVSVDYRLAPETKVAGIIEDIQDAFRWVRERGPELLGIDPDRLGVVGHSAGGYLTLMAGCCVKPRPAALVAFYGYGDIAGPWYSRPDPFYCRQPAVPREEAYAAVGQTVISEPPEPNRRSRFYLYCRQQGIWPQEVAGHDPDREPEAFEPFCPVRNVSAEYPPTMLLHGDRDTDVPFEQSVMMAGALARCGVEHEFVQMPGGGHGFDAKPEAPGVAGAFERVLAFLKRHLMDKRPFG